jgi:cystathionine beta-lyase
LIARAEKEIIVNKYDFDTIIDRRHTASMKWDSNQDENILPMWVADMDFSAPPPVVEAIKARAAAGIFGYTFPPDSYQEAIVEWMRRRHEMVVNPEWIKFGPGVVPALNMLIRAYTNPGDKVIIQTPVYYPFFISIANNHRQVTDNQLKLEDGQYGMDFDDLEIKARDPGAKLLILCSPHNPVGRVWSREELTRLGDICLRNNVIVIADEIHNDLIYRGHRHTVFATISEAFARHSVTCTAPSKTFNLAGLQTASIIIPDERLRALYSEVLESNFLRRPNIFGIVALEAAYRHGEEWLEQLLDYLQGNRDYLMEFIDQKLPQIKVVKPQGTYLVWMDFRELGLRGRQLEDFMLNKAHLWLDEGYIFGSAGDGFERINIACPRGTLSRALDQLYSAVRGLEG